jgi:hypothetical protein
VVEHNLAKVGVESSNLFARSSRLKRPGREIGSFSISALGVASSRFRP